MSQEEKEKDTKEKKVPSWSIEEMKERQNTAVEEDTEEMKRWRSLNQSEMDLCWKNLAERMEEEVLDKYKVEESKRGSFKGRGDPLELRKVSKNKRYKIRKVERRLLGNNFLLVQRIQFAVFAKQAEGVNKRGGDEAAAKDGYHEDPIKKIKSKGWMDSKNRWWVAELLAKDCEKAWTHTGWEDTMQEWYEWLEYIEKIIKNAKGSAGLHHKITKSTMWRGGVQILKEEENA